MSVSRTVILPYATPGAGGRGSDFLHVRAIFPLAAGLILEGLLGRTTLSCGPYFTEFDNRQLIRPPCITLPFLRARAERASTHVGWVYSPTTAAHEALPRATRVSPIGRAGRNVLPNHLSELQDAFPRGA
jgi:hypothetical protein